MCTRSLAPSPMVCTPSKVRFSWWNSSLSRPVLSPMIWPRLFLVFLELRRYEPLGVRERLLSDIVLWHGSEVRLGHFDIVAENLVVAYFERTDARALPLALLDARDPSLAFGADGPQPVKTGVIPFFDQPALPERKGRIVVNGLVDELIQVREVVPLQREVENQLCPGVLQHPSYLRHREEGLLQRQKVARVRGAERHAADQSLQVIDLAERLPELRTEPVVFLEPGDGVEPAFDLRRVHQRVQKPLAQLSAPHRGNGEIEHRK